MAWQGFKNGNYKVKSLIALVAMAATAFFCSQNAFAVEGCATNPDANPDSCWCDSTSCGAAWINSSPWGNDLSNYAYVDNPSTNNITLYVHGAVRTMWGGTPPDAWRDNWAIHVYLLDSEYTGGSEWNEWTQWAAEVLHAPYISGHDGGLYRGVVSGWPGDWSSGWGNLPAMPINVDLDGFINGAWRNGDEYTRIVHVFRCYYTGNGCGSTPTFITIRIPEDCGGAIPTDYRVYYEGKVSLRNGYGSPLFKNGQPFTNNESISWAGNNAEWSGWSDADNNSNFGVDLYTPKDSGQKLNSSFQLKYSGNDWAGKETSRPEYAWPLILNDWYTKYDFSSGIGNTSGGSYYMPLYYHLSDPWEAEREVTPRKSTTVSSIPYGTSKSYTETLHYRSVGSNVLRITQHFCVRAGKISGGWVDSYNIADPDGVDRTRQITTTIHNPYNFNTSMSSAINGGSGATLIGGGTATLRYRADIMPKVNPNINNYTYYSKVPNDTKVSAVSFVLKPGVDYSAATRYSDSMKDRVAGVPNGNLCQYLAGIFGSNMYRQGEANGCQTLIDRNGSAINNNLGNAGNKITNGAGASAIAGEESKSVAIPDIEDGHKYCTVIGISHTDSGNGFNVNNNWHISNISCRTIAKVPTFQAWGGVYTSGGINTATVKKIPSAGINTASGSQTYLFGSWAETLAIANQQIHGFATGAAIGYRGDKVGGLPVNSASNKINYCNVTNISIANNRCSSGVSGNAGNVVVSNDDFLSKFLSRYSTTTTDRLEQITDSVRYIKTKGDATFNDTPAIAENGYRLGNGVVSVKEGTIIFQVNGDVNINHNICTGYANNNGQCTNGSTSAAAYNSYALANENYQYRAGSKIPQVIIIASGDVNISKDVTEIDAWIYSGKTIKTCADGNIRNNTCNNPLLVNGPVFAKNIELYRTYGSNGTRSWDGPLAANSNLLNSGAATPAEIFNLRADVYQWIYQQTSTENKAANVRYMRELSPRF